eukprot:Nitzschia sp. Nitz4//scaffold16_size188269//107285//108578//NITZ4_001796-RA/size188269-augustus-gene-0.94-mRNA-1//-1//CDS//3329538532//409//frame0
MLSSASLRIPGTTLNMFPLLLIFSFWIGSGDAFVPSSLSIRRFGTHQRSPSLAQSADGALHANTIDNWQENFPFAGSLRPYPQSPQRQVRMMEVKSRPDYADDGHPKLISHPYKIEVKTPQEIEHMRASGKLTRHVLDQAGKAVQAGVTTDEIDALVHEITVAAGAYPSPLNYHGFPKSCCTSLNEVVCHGIPDKRKLQEGDIINIDISVYLNGFHGDASEMFVVGEVDPQAKQLLQTTYDSWILACQHVRPDRKYQELGGIIEDHINQAGSFSTVRNFCGHGIGSIFHAAPDILHYRNRADAGIMKPGHTFTIEPMICEGSAHVLNWPDRWTVTTVDGKRSAQFEHTLLVTEDGVEALTSKTEDSMVQFWERESKYQQGFFTGTTDAAKKTSEAIRAKLGF